MKNILLRITRQVRYVFTERRNLFQNVFTTLAPIDLMLPIDGKFTVGQYIVISRLIDIESIAKGEEPVWHVKLSEAFSGQALTKETIKKNNASFISLVKSLDYYGISYNISHIFVNSTPFFIYTGTHRCGWCLYKNPLQPAPVRLTNLGWLFAYEDGEKFWENKGVSEEDLKILKKRLEELLMEYDLSLSVITSLQTENYENLRKQIEEIGKITNVEERKILSTADDDLNIDSELRGFIDKNQGNIIIHISVRLFKNHLYIRDDSIKSRILDETLGKIFAPPIKIKTIYYCPTITKSQELKIVLNNCSEITSCSTSISL